MELETSKPFTDGPLNGALNYLRAEFTGYPYDAEKDLRYFQNLQWDFPQLDIEEELKQYHAWVLDQPSWKKISYRSRFRQWLKRSIEFRMGRWRGIPYATTR